MSEPTNKQIAAFLNDFADTHESFVGDASKDAAWIIRLAALRLAARGEVTEAMADRAKNAIRILMLNYSEDFLDAVAHAALTAALNGEEG